MLTFFVFLLFCIFTNTHGRIFNGQQAKNGQFPWQVEIMIPKNSGSVTHCGGAIINEQWILTAAHCIIGPTLAGEDPQREFNFTITMGTVDLNSTDKVVITANEFRVYDLFNPYSFGDGDIALIKLTDALNFTDYIKPIALGTVGDDVKVFASGWGYAHSGDTQITQFLTYGNFTTLSDEDCRTRTTLGEGAMCVVPSGTITQNICGGESGSALATDPFGDPRHVGVVVWYKTCEGDNVAGFSRTEYFLNWITKTMQSS